MEIEQRTDAESSDLESVIFGMENVLIANAGRFVVGNNRHVSQRLVRETKRFLMLNQSRLVVLSLENSGLSWSELESILKEKKSAILSLLSKLRK